MRCPVMTGSYLLNLRVAGSNFAQKGRTNHVRAKKSIEDAKAFQKRLIANQWENDLRGFFPPVLGGEREAAVSVHSGKAFQEWKVCRIRRHELP